MGYTITNLVGGYLASSLSAKQVLGWGVLVWSFFTITTPAAAAVSMPLLLANRAVMGAGEGVTFPCVQNIVKGWVPADTRTRALTLIYSGGQLGTIVALITAPLIIKVCMGWGARFKVEGGQRGVGGVGQRGGGQRQQEPRGQVGLWKEGKAREGVYHMQLAVQRCLKSVLRHASCCTIPSQTVLCCAVLCCNTGLGLARCVCHIWLAGAVLECSLEQVCGRLPPTGSTT